MDRIDGHLVGAVVQVGGSCNTAGADLSSNPRLGLVLRLYGAIAPANPDVHLGIAFPRCAGISY